MRDQGLYFIAILPPEEISNHVIAIKQEFADRFDSKHALKLPAHITLQPPFFMKMQDEENFKKILADFFIHYSSFDIQCKNFGCFDNKNNPVIFILPLENEIMNGTYKNLMLFLRKLGFSEKQTPLKFHPHMTVAYRDLSPENFRQAWPEFSQRNFEAAFHVDNIFLLKHNGKKWVAIQGFKLGLHFHQDS